MMSEYWIITSHECERHTSLDEAKRGHEMLRRYLPGITFTIHRCKASLHSAHHFTKLVDLLRDIVKDGFTPENRDRATILLQTIKNRSEMPVSPNAPPEFKPLPFKRRTA